ncbi:MAG: HAD family hydrolase [Terriglobia bacterium]
MRQQNQILRDIRLIIFDLDGTLIDSQADLASSVNATRARLGLPDLSEQVITSYVGNGVPALVRRALGGGASEAEIQFAVAFFLEHYRLHMLDHTHLYPGVRETLAALASRRMAVLTNKPVNFSRAILAGLKLDSHFADVYGGNSFAEKKPHPAGVLRLLEDSGVTARQALIVGDSRVDVETGRNAGVWTCGVTYGISSGTLAVVEPDLLVNDLRELPPLLDGARSRSIRGDGNAG